MEDDLVDYESDPYELAMTKYASFASPYIMLATFFFIWIFFLKARILVLVLLSP